MASTKRKKGFTFKFDLSLAGLLGVGVVCFCIFLWMFLLGIWSGQTVLSSAKDRISRVKKPSVETLQPVAKKSVSSSVSPTEKAVAKPIAQAVLVPDSKKKEIPATTKKVSGQKIEPTPESEADPAFFAVQVAAFKDGTLAAKEVRSWQDKGYKPFSRPPEGADDKFTRVYIGRFDSMEAAKAKAVDVSKDGKIKPFIVLVPAE